MEKQWYRVAPGVTWVNGARVPAGGKVLLSQQEAQHDLDLERLVLVSKRRVGARKSGG